MPVMQSFSRIELQQLSFCLNNAYRKTFHMNKWECLRKLNFVSRIVSSANNILHVAFVVYKDLEFLTAF